MHGKPDRRLVQRRPFYTMPRVSGNLDEIAAVGIAVLAHEQDLAVARKRDDPDRAGMADVFAGALAAVGQPHDIAANLEQRSVEHLLARDEPLGQVRGL